MNQAQQLTTIIEKLPEGHVSSSRLSLEGLREELERFVEKPENGTIIFTIASSPDYQQFFISLETGFVHIWNNKRNKIFRIMITHNLIVYRPTFICQKFQLDSNVEFNYYQRCTPKSLLPVDKTVKTPAYCFINQNMSDLILLGFFDNYVCVWSLYQYHNDSANKSEELSPFMEIFEDNNCLRAKEQIQSDFFICNKVIMTHKKSALYLERKSRKVTVQAINLSNDGKTLITGNSDSSIDLWDLTGCKQNFLRSCSKMSKEKEPIKAVISTRDDNEIISATESGKIYVIDTNTLQRKLSFEVNLRGNALKSLTLTDDNQLTIGLANKTIVVWNLKDNYEEYRINGLLFTIICSVSSSWKTVKGLIRA